MLNDAEAINHELVRKVEERKAELENEAREIAEIRSECEQVEEESTNLQLELDYLMKKAKEEEISER